MLAFAWTALRPGVPETMAVVVPPSTSVAVAALRVPELPAPDAPRGVAEMKPYFEGVLSPEARTKPQPENSLRCQAGQRS